MKILNLGVPRTASRYVAETLQPNAGHGHYEVIGGKCYDLASGHLVDLDGLFLVGIVRNPFDLLVSHWRILAHPDFADHPDADLGRLPFGDYLAHVAERDDAPPGVFPRPGSLFGQLLNGERMVAHYLGRYETLDADLHAVARITGGTHLPGPRVNTSPRRAGWQDYYDQATIRLAEDRWGDDLTTFGYSFAGVAEPAVTYGEQA